jgi:1-deoxyxylulose-5-phosphate synthase
MTYGDPGWREWVLGEAESLPFYKKALDIGVNFFDTADMYSLGASEEVTGRALKGLNRDGLIIATKVFNPMGDGPNDRGLSRKHIISACEASLRRLQTDYIDLYQIHRFDYETPIEETVEALDSLVRSGKVRYLGASSMYAWQFMKMLATADKLGVHRFVSMQPQYNLVYREEEREMLPLCIEEGIAVLPWSPLARGFLTRKGDETIRGKTDGFAQILYTSENDRAIANRLQEIATARGLPAAQIALAWMLQKAVITSPIIGASKMSHLEDAAASLEVKLDDGEIQLLEELYVPHPVKDHS